MIIDCLQKGREGGGLRRAGIYRGHETSFPGIARHIINYHVSNYYSLRLKTCVLNVENTDHVLMIARKNKL